MSIAEQVPQLPLTAEQRKHLDELYRLQVGSVKSLARLLGYPCPIVSREEKRTNGRQPVDDNAILTSDKK